jgi:hypothetical protein
MYSSFVTDKISLFVLTRKGVRFLWEGVGFIYTSMREELYRYDVM